MNPSTPLVALLSVIGLSACVTTYQAPKDTPATATMTFARDAKTSLLGSTTVFVKVADDFTCRPGRGFLQTQRLAVFDTGNPFIKDSEGNELIVEAGDDFRMLVRNLSGKARCDTIVSFDVQSDASYHLLAKSNLTPNNTNCFVELYQKDDTGNTTPIKFKQYQNCQQGFFRG